ncbi:hypothetical protein AXW67_20055 [Bradyrhizobium neotropicale]|uniref:Uncharacterized protein n=1 Tax=Bradyrhizobium neotropicale TaxID=1497615 RepID=A0A176YXQ0_9BRAD|nr:hypothetical protein AXW67_20055 [Bradyrhizobium neotropicale]
MNYFLDGPPNTLHEVIVVRIGRSSWCTLDIIDIAAFSVVGFGQIQWRFVCSLPFTVTVLRPLVGVLGWVKRHRRVSYINKTQRCCAGFCFWVHGIREDQRSFAVEPKLMFQENIACVIYKRMSNPKIYSGCGFGPPGKLVPPLISFEHIIHAGSAFRAKQSNALVA